MIDKYDFYGSYNFGDRAVGAIVAGDEDAFFEYAGCFWENRYFAKKYIEKAFICGSNDLALKIIKICEEKAPSQNNVLFLLTYAIEAAAKERCPELIKIFADMMKNSAGVFEYTRFINKAMVNCISGYGKDAPEISYINMLVEAGADINYSIYKHPFSLVGAAVNAGKYKFALDLMDRPDFDILKHQPPTGRYSLINIIISSSRDTDIKVRLLKKLISLGADINTRGSGIGFQSFSPVGLSVFMEDPMVFHILEKSGADLYERDISGNNTFDYIKPLRETDPYSNTVKFLNDVDTGRSGSITIDSDKPLFVAIKKGSAVRVRKALENGISANARYRYGMPALSFALAHRTGSDIIKLLLEAGADPNICDDRGIPSFFIPSLWLKLSDTPDLIRYNGIKVPGTERTESGTRDKYIWLDHTLKDIKEAVSMMLEAGADPNMKANDKQKKYGFFERKSQPTNACEDDLFYGLHMNVLKAYMDVYWKESCSRDSVFGYDTIYPYLKSCRKSVNEIFEDSFKNGLDPNYSSGTGETLVDMAAAANMNSVLSMLIEHGADLDRYEPLEPNPFLYAIPEGVPSGGYIRTFMEIRHKMRHIDPNLPAGLQYGERGMSDLEMNDKISAVRGTAEILLKNGFVPDLVQLTNIIKSEPFYSCFPEVREFLLDADGYSMRVRSLDREDCKESEGATGYEFDI